MGRSRRCGAAVPVLVTAIGLASCASPAVRTAPEVTTQPLPSSPSSPTGPASPTSPTASPGPYEVTPADFAAVRRLMRARASAVLDHDRGAFLATVDRRQPDLVQQQLTLYDNLTALHLTHLSYAVADDAFVADPVPGDDPTFRPEAYEQVQIARTLAAPITNQVNDTFVRRDGDWLLGAETQPDSENSFGAPLERPWFGGPVSVATDGPVTVLVDASSTTSASSLLHTVVADLATDARVLGVPPHEPVLVDATSNGLTHAMNSQQSDQAGAVTLPVYSTDPLDTVRRKLAGHVVKANPTYVAQLLLDDVTLKHELTHLLLHRYGGIVPTWVTEGIAEYVGAFPGRDQLLTRDPAALAAVLRREPEIPVSGKFDLDFVAGYAIAESAVHHLVTTYGMPRFLRLLDTYRRDYREPYGDEITDRVLHQVYGIHLPALADAVWEDLRESTH